MEGTTAVAAAKKNMRNLQMNVCSYTFSIYNL